MITIDEFAKMQVQVGTVLSSERVPETDKLLRLMVDFGPKPIELAQKEIEEEVESETLNPLLVFEPIEERDIRQIVSGINAYVNEPEDLVGRQLAFVTNLEPRTIKGLESNGMLFAVGQGDTFAFLTPSKSVPPGTSAH